MSRTPKRAGINSNNLLCPGVWTVEISKEDIPRFHYVEKEEYIVKLSPAERKRLPLRILPKRRRVMIIEGTP